MVRHTNKRRTNKRRQRKYKKQTRRVVHRKKSLRRRHNKKQRGGYNKNKNGNITYISTDKRYRPVGGIFDTVKFKANSLMNNIQGKYKPVNPSVSSQPISKPLTVQDLKIGVGSTADATQLFKDANLQAATYA